MDWKKLKEPFEAADIEWRVQQAGAKNNKPWAMVLAYVTNRAIQERLDEVCGPENWKNEYAQGPDGGILCGISIKVDGEWITKWDGAENTQVEAVKGGLSGAMKRAAVQWGIGRYLYKLESNFAEVCDNGKHYQGRDKGGKYEAFKWNPPKLPAWALPAKQKKESTKPKIDTETPPPEPISRKKVGEPEPDDPATDEQMQTIKDILYSPVAADWSKEQSEYVKNAVDNGISKANAAKLIAKIDDVRM